LQIPVNYRKTNLKIIFGNINANILFNNVFFHKILFFFEKFYRNPPTVFPRNALSELLPQGCIPKYFVQTFGENKE
jgi:hypothetical protein